MDLDIRISVSFLDHPKTIKLKRRLGFDGVESLLALWLWCRANKPCGVLHGMDEEDIEIAARWNGESGAFVNECLTLRWLDVNDPLTENNCAKYSLHDWAEHNPWAIGTEDRSNAARFNRMAKTHPELHEKLKKEGKKTISVEEYQSLTKINEPLTVVKESLTPAPSPAPSPLPTPPVEDIVGQQPRPRNNVPVSEIVKFLNDKAGTQFKDSTDSTKKHIKARFAEKFTFDDFKTVIEFKVSEWGTDAKMREFLRPQTLFGTKFESYLQAAQVAPVENEWGIYGKWKDK
jgi:uncharacterized phage protein (TIGR02220 family)